jgi:glutaminyl-tRNA synthetase
LNPESKQVAHGFVEASAAHAAPETFYQFERIGYYVADRKDHTAVAPVFNRSVTLRDTWMQKSQ